MTDTTQLVALLQEKLAQEGFSIVPTDELNALKAGVSMTAHPVSPELGELLVAAVGYIESNSASSGEAYTVLRRVVDKISGRKIREANLGYLKDEEGPVVDDESDPDAEDEKDEEEEVETCDCCGELEEDCDCEICADCDSKLRPDDDRGHRDKWICKDCGENYINCSSCDRVVHQDSIQSINDESMCSNCAGSWTYCERGDHHVDSDTKVVDYTVAGRGYSGCTECMEKHGAHECVHCDTFTDECVKDEDDDWCCPDHAPEEEEEAEEEAEA